MKIGISWDNIHILPLNQKISIAGIDVTCFDANHCPGSIIILFEPPSGKVCSDEMLVYLFLMSFIIIFEISSKLFSLL